MKKFVISLLLAIVLLNVLPLHADQVYADTAAMVKHSFGLDISDYSMLNKSALALPEKKVNQSVSTNVFTHQYTTDGWLQLVAIYADSVIATNLAGPREGFQIIIMNNGAVLDTSNSYKIHTDYFSHKYSWGEVRTYKTHQTVIFK